jgi:hypothetical protein
MHESMPFGLRYVDDGILKADFVLTRDLRAAHQPRPR